MSMENPGFIQNEDEARKAAYAEKPLRDFARRKDLPISHETKLAIDKDAEVAGEEGSQEYLSEQAEKRSVEHSTVFFRDRYIELFKNNPLLVESEWGDRTAEVREWEKSASGHKIVDELKAVQMANSLLWKRLAALRGVEYTVVRREQSDIVEQELEREGLYPVSSAVLPQG